MKPKKNCQFLFEVMNMFFFFFCIYLVLHYLLSQVFWMQAITRPVCSDPQDLSGRSGSHHTFTPLSSGHVHQPAQLQGAQREPGKCFLIVIHSVQCVEIAGKVGSHVIGQPGTCSIFCENFTAFYLLFTMHSSMKVMCYRVWPWCGPIARS